MRRMEMAADALYKAKLIRGFCHLAIGQEAISIGLESAITPEDRVITAYRCHPFAVLRGGTIKGVIAELLGKSFLPIYVCKQVSFSVKGRQAGMSHGKGGSMHIFTPSFFGGNGIVGAQVPVGLGIAFAQKYLNRGTATFAMYGDGASNQGQVFEAFNMASIFYQNGFPADNLSRPSYGMCHASLSAKTTNTAWVLRPNEVPPIPTTSLEEIPFLDFRSVILGHSYSL